MQLGKSGFTLIELLVVVIIIAVLAAVALPQYQRAVNKSRFHALMPLAHAVYTGNEMYFLTEGHYSSDIHALDLKGPPQDVEGASFELHNDESYSYVLAQRANLNNRYVVYQNHSKQFPGNIHCEAKNEDATAIWLCENALKGEKINRGSLTPGYTSYILKGSATDGAFTVDYENESGVTLQDGDTCTGSKEGSCQHVTASGATCTGQGKNACSNSTYEQSTCEGNQATACSNSSFTNSTCIASGQGACMGSEFTDSACTGNTGGTNANNTSCGSGSVYTRSTCKNLSNNGYSCGRSTYTTESSCYSNEKGGCGHSTFTGNSHCYGIGGTSCDVSEFLNGSVCHANGKGSCASGTYDATSYCAGDYCPAGSPKQDGTKWRACDSAHGDPADRISGKKSC